MYINANKYRIHSRFCKIFFDGKEPKNCFAADDKKGIIWVYKKDEKGKFIFDKEKNDLVTEERHGKVKIKIVYSKIFSAILKETTIKLILLKWKLWGD